MNCNGDFDKHKLAKVHGHHDTLSNIYGSLEIPGMNSVIDCMPSSDVASLRERSFL